MKLRNKIRAHLLDALLVYRSICLELITHRVKKMEPQRWNFSDNTLNRFEAAFKPV